MKRCNHCGKIWILKYNFRHWLIWLFNPSRRLDGYPNHLRYQDVDGNATWTIFSNFHQTGWGIYCNPCWPEYLREVEHDYGRF